MNWTWTWYGRFFGYWDDKDLGTYHGKHVGRRVELHIYSPNGRYLGEVIVNDRLAINKIKVGHMSSPFLPSAAREPQLLQSDQIPLSLYAGFDDFRGPENF